jgi:hypothetical protein
MFILGPRLFWCFFSFVGFVTIRWSCMTPWSSGCWHCKWITFIFWPPLINLHSQYLLFCYPLVFQVIPWSSASSW